MAAMAINKADAALESGYSTPTCDAVGAVRSSLFHPDGYSLWQLRAELDEGTELRWGAVPHGDEALFVLEGELDVDGVACGPETAVIIEADASACLRANTATTILHFGPASIEQPGDGVFGPPLKTGHGVHVVSLEEARPLDPDSTVGPRYYTDSTCKTCRIAFFKVAMPEARVTGSHVHSEDEIIHVLTGELQVGRDVVGAGMSVAIPGDHRYGFRTPGAFSFLNYRRDASTYVAKPGSDPILETVDSFRATRAAAAAAPAS
jgi:quercetin dioxygenase-like cupin family protein